MRPATLAQPASLLWPERRLPVAIGPRQVHIWAWTFLSGPGPSEADMQVLDEGERRRALRFYFAPDRIRYSACHANLRRILGSYLERPPESLTFREAEGGKPALVLDDSDAPLRFNLSHSKNIALLAVALEMAVGVDVENVRPIERDVANRFFSPREVASMTPLEGEAWLDAFYRCWTRKEAVLKGEGLGLRIPLDSFDVSVLPDEPAALIAARPEAKLTAHWHLHHLAPSSGSIAALAVGEPGANVVTFSLAS